jgi:hypothetical protein
MSKKSEDGTPTVEHKGWFDASLAGVMGFIGKNDPDGNPYIEDADSQWLTEVAARRAAGDRKLSPADAQHLKTLAIKLKV